MLEILRLLSFQEEAEIQNPLVFLFNGAEELGLQGAHGFVRGKEDTYQGLEGHPWSQNLGVFINLEGAGGGGRDILFQATGGIQIILHLN
jgi:Zn-dependent M28 family amino/carboxypeptidase